MLMTSCKCLQIIIIIIIITTIIKMMIIAIIIIIIIRRRRIRIIIINDKIRDQNNVNTSSGKNLTSLSIRPFFKFLQK